MRHVRAQRTPWRDSVDVLIYEENDGARWVTRAEFTVERLQEGQVVGEPTFTLEAHTGQELMDALWDCGLRPSEGSGSAGQLAATQKHLEDMRLIALQGFRGTA